MDSVPDDLAAHPISATQNPEKPDGVGVVRLVRDLKNLVLLAEVVCGNKHGARETVAAVLE